MKNLSFFFLLISLFLISCNAPQKAQTKVIKLLETTKSWNGDTLPKYLEGTPQVTILKIIIPPKTKLKMHKHPVMNAAVMLKGELMVITTKQDTLKIKEGNAFEEVVNTWHYGLNNSNKPVEVLVFYAGVKERPITLHK